MEYFAETNIGENREKNEDYFYAKDNLFIVADGMGGHRAGEVASKIAVETFVKDFHSIIQNPAKKSSTGKKAGNLTQKKIKDSLMESIKNSNEAVFKKAELQPEYYGMGTTLTGCYIYSNKAYIAHIGDSRLYIKRGSDFKLLTSDHTIVGELFRKGSISYEEAFDHPQRNYLTNVIGIARDAIPDFYSYKIQPGDLILLCSDGLSSTLRDKDISKIIDNCSKTKDIAKSLIKETLKKEGMDNVTVVAIKV
ncbi:MAG: Stp1/IreP family PP2C-type Ser/Thr phosphatase [Actinomycetota bacterium]|nr:Stp1/IreP family PP2C-type Ser/Thr phosphatase [Actinomycetota bacterium]